MNKTRPVYSLITPAQKNLINAKNPIIQDQILILIHPL